MHAELVLSLPVFTVSGVVRTLEKYLLCLVADSFHSV